MIVLRKKFVIISLSLCASICIFVFWLLFTILTGGKGYLSPEEWFFSNHHSYTDFSYDFPTRKLIPVSKIVELPMGEKKTLFIGYAKDSSSEEIIVMVSGLMVKNGYYRPMDTHFKKISEFENGSIFKNDDTGFYSIDYYKVPYNSTEKDNYDLEIYDLVETEYIDSKGEKQHVIFFYTWEDISDHPGY